MSRPPEPLKVDMTDLEFAFGKENENVFTHYLDRRTGEVVAVPGIAYMGDEDEETEAALELVESDHDRFLLLESSTDLRPSVDDARAFSAEVDDEPFRRRLLAAFERPRGASRRFLDVLHEELGEVERWHHVRGHLCDDLHVLRLPRELIATPPLVIWPRTAVHGELPHDVLEAFGLR